MKNPLFLWKTGEQRIFSTTYYKLFTTSEHCDLKNATSPSGRYF